jgi:hypothetical protein
MELVQKSFDGASVSVSNSATLYISGGTLTGSTLSVSSGIATIDGGCVLTSSPLTISAADGTVGRLALAQCELQSDGSSVPLTVESGGNAIVTDTVVRSTAGDITAVVVSNGGRLSVAESRLANADDSTDQFPCDGSLAVDVTLLTCDGPHTGLVVVDVSSVISTVVQPLVCDAATGHSLSDLCAIPDRCNGHGTCASPLGACTCAPRHPVLPPTIAKHNDARPSSVATVDSGMMTLAQFTRCEAHGMVDGRKYPGPWTGARCEAPPTTVMECCSTNDCCSGCRRQGYCNQGYPMTGPYCSCDSCSCTNTGEGCGCSCNPSC